MNYTRGYFVEGSDNAYFGWSDSTVLWNGTQTPIFEKKVAKKIIEHCPGIGEFYNVWFDRKTDAFYIEDLTLDEIEERITSYKGRDIVIKSKVHHVYDIGSFEWIWFRYTLKELKEDDSSEGNIYR